MSETKLKYHELTRKIIGCAMEVHRRLGSGFQEVIYQRALTIEMELAGISFIREKYMNIYYRGHEIGTRRTDFLVEDVISTEIKAVVQLSNTDLAQGINYLEAYDLEVGLLINFGAKSLEYKRLHNNKFRQKGQGNPFE